MKIKMDVDFDNLNKIIDECPKIPQPPIIEKINPPPYLQPRILLGLAKEDGEKDKKKGKPKKPPQKEKGPPPKPIKWEVTGPLQKKSTLDYIDDARK